MSTTLASAVIARAAGLLQDTSFTRWPELKQLEWLIDGQREAAMLNPLLYVRTVDHTLTKGTKQTLPADGRELVDVPRNVNGDAITQVARRALDSQVPDWHSAARANKKVLHFCYAPTDAKHFLVFPASPGGNAVELVYAAIPPELGLSSVISLDDSYVGALVDYLMYRAYEKDSEHAPTAAAAGLHRASFIALVKGTGSTPQAAPA